MIKRGMRATLQSTSIITGSKEIALERIDGAPPATLEKQGDVYVIPLLGGRRLRRHHAIGGRAP